jgi:hypothetical protein
MILRQAIAACAVLWLVGCSGSSQDSARDNARTNNDEPTTNITTPTSNAIPRIIQESLFRQNDFYGIRGTVFNPTDRAMKNVTIKYYLYKSHMGKPNEGLVVHDTGGLVEARLAYLPPKTPIDFVAYSENAPTGGRIPEIASEITAEWD